MFPTVRGQVVGECFDGGDFCEECFLYSNGTSCGECFIWGTFVRNVSYTVRGPVVGECFVGGTFCEECFLQ